MVYLFGDRVPNPIKTESYGGALMLNYRKSVLIINFVLVFINKYTALPRKKTKIVFTFAWGSGQVRTDDLRNHNPPLYQLSYWPHVKNAPIFRPEKMPCKDFFSREQLPITFPVIYGLILNSERRFTRKCYTQRRIGSICSQSEN